MSEVDNKKPARKVLSLKLAGQTPNQPQFIQEPWSVYMVWCDGGDMPKRVYRADEKNRAMAHAKKLAAETGKRFYVMRSYRGYEMAPSDEG